VLWVGVLVGVGPWLSGVFEDGYLYEHRHVAVRSGPRTDGEPYQSASRPNHQTRGAKFLRSAIKPATQTTDTSSTIGIGRTQTGQFARSTTNRRQRSRRATLGITPTVARCRMVRRRKKPARGGL